MSIFNQYEKNTALDANDLLGKLKTFIETRGFTILDFFQEGTGQRLHASRNGTIYNFKSFIDTAPFSSATAFDITDWQQVDSEPYNSGICLSISNGYVNTTAYDEQEGAIFDNNYNMDNDNVIGNPILLTDGAITEYDFFYNGNVIYIACQFNAGYYSHLCFGDIDKIGVYNKGGFASGSFYHKFDVFRTNDTPRPSLYCKNKELFSGSDESYLFNQILIDNSVRKIGGFIGTVNGNSNVFEWDFTKRSKNPFLSGKGTLLSSLFFTEEKVDGDTSSIMPVGTAKGLYNVYFENYAPKEIITIGARHYVVFPYWQKSSPWDDTIQESSGMGVAIQVDGSYVA